MSFWPEPRSVVSRLTIRTCVCELAGSRDASQLTAILKTYDPEMPVNPLRPTVSNLQVHTPSSQLRTLPFKILRSRIGDDSFHHLFVHASCFSPVGNNCYAQLSGEALYDRVPLSKQTEPVNQETPGSRKRKRGKIEERKRKKQRPDDNPTEGSRGCHGVARKKAQSLADTIIPRGKMFYGQGPPPRGDRPRAGLPPTRQSDCLLGATAKY